MRSERLILCGLLMREWYQGCQEITGRIFSPGGLGRHEPSWIWKPGSRLARSIHLVEDDQARPPDVDTETAFAMIVPNGANGGVDGLANRARIAHNN